MVVFGGLWLFAMKLLGQKAFNVLGQAAVKGWCLWIGADPAQNELEVAGFNIGERLAFVPAERHATLTVIGPGVSNWAWLAG
jgi:hypothetical protein